MRDPTDTRQVDTEREAAAAAKRERQRRDIEDLKWLLEQAQGRRFVWRLLEQAGVYQSTFNSSGSVTAFNEGKRAIGLWALAQIHDHTPDVLATMIKASSNDN